MKEAIVDASSAILLYKAGLLPPLSNTYRWVMTKTAFAEVTVTHRPGSEAFAHAQRTQRLRVIVSPAPTEALAGSRMGAGERETIAAAKAGLGDFVIIDDGAGARCCRDLAIAFVNALLCPKLLYFNGIIDVERCRRAVEAICRLGRYSAAVLEFAANCDAADMAMFLNGPPSLEKKECPDFIRRLAPPDTR